jgi:hypothetical protein
MFLSIIRKKGKKCNPGSGENKTGCIPGTKMLE